jgi:hypothetical protein
MMAQMSELEMDLRPIAREVIFLEGLGPKTGANRCQSSRYPEEEACSSLARKGEYVEFNTGL